jgi:hypothetical protein
MPLLCALMPSLTPNWSFNCAPEVLHVLFIVSQFFFFIADCSNSSTLSASPEILLVRLSIFFFSTGFWTQGLHLEPLHQPFVWKGFFWDRVSWTICLGWLQTAILLISISWIARITGMSHWCLVPLSFKIWLTELLLAKIFFPFQNLSLLNFSSMSYIVFFNSLNCFYIFLEFIDLF